VGLRRPVGPFLPTGIVEIPALPSRLTLDCEREISDRLQIAPGEVEALSLARARTRWPGYRSYVQAVESWTREIGLNDILSECEIALMACRGARYHHDAEQYGDKAFCNLFLSEDKGLDLHFPTANKRIALQRGSVVIFDTAQTHAVVKRNCSEFLEEHFPPESDCSLLFLTWELPLANAAVTHVLSSACSAA
jgi:hypothetical protein